MKKRILGLSLIAISAIILTGCGGEKKETFFKDGQLKTVAHYNSESKLDGEYIKYYRNGSIQMKTTYENGKINGLLEEFSSDGKKRGSCIFKEGEKYQDCKQYDSKENLKKVENFDEKSALHGIQQEYKSEKLVNETNYSHGLRDGRTMIKNKDFSIDVIFKEGVIVGGEGSVYIRELKKYPKVEIKTNGDFVRFVRKRGLISKYVKVEGLNRK